MRMAYLFSIYNDGKLTNYSENIRKALLNTYRDLIKFSLSTMIQMLRVPLENRLYICMGSSIKSAMFMIQSQ